jgi:hypothetical protein
MTTLVTLFIGAGACGKTQSLYELAVEQDRFPHYNVWSLNQCRYDFAANADVIRRILPMEEPTPEEYKLAFDHCQDDKNLAAFSEYQQGELAAMVDKAANYEIPLYLDGMHLRSKYRKPFIESMTGRGLTVRGAYANCSLDVALQRNELGHNIDPSHIKKQFGMLDVPEESEFNGGFLVFDIGRIKTW